MLCCFDDEDGFPNAVGGGYEYILLHRLVVRIGCGSLRVGQGAVKKRIVTLANRVIGNIILISQCEKLGQIPGWGNVDASQWRGNRGAKRSVCGGVSDRLHGLDLQRRKAAEVSPCGAADGSEEPGIYFVAYRHQIRHGTGLAI